MESDEYRQFWRQPDFDTERERHSPPKASGWKIRKSPLILFSGIFIVEKEEKSLSGKPSNPHGYTMDELLAVSDYSQPQPLDEREWIDAPAIGRELV
ncbi:hypothetical protein [Acetobacter senegalensis]|nr:hypothetical protein [Acetobacter senegalensis]